MNTSWRAGMLLSRGRALLDRDGKARSMLGLGWARGQEATWHAGSGLGTVMKSHVAHWFSASGSTALKPTGDS